MHPSASSFADAVRVFIVSMAAEDVEARYPIVSGLPAGTSVFVVMSEAGYPLLITDTHAEAMRRVSLNANVVLGQLH